ARLAGQGEGSELAADAEAGRLQHEPAAVLAEGRGAGRAVGAAGGRARGRLNPGLLPSPPSTGERGARKNHAHATGSPSRWLAHASTPANAALSRRANSSTPDRSVA